MAYRLNQVNEDFINDKLNKQKQKSKFPKNFNKKIDITKITNWISIKKWIQHRIDQLIPDDEIFVEYVYELIRGDSPCPDIKAIQLQVDDFLGKEDSLKFCSQLWQLLIDSENGTVKEKRKEKEKGLEEKGLEEKNVEEESVEIPKKTKTNYNRSSSSSKNTTRPTSYRNESEREYKRDRNEPKYKATYGQRETPDERYKDERRIRSRR